jgi:hypothetical protein
MCGGCKNASECVTLPQRNAAATTTALVDAVTLSRNLEAWCKNRACSDLLLLVYQTLIYVSGWKAFCPQCLVHVCLCCYWCHHICSLLCYVSDSRIFHSAAIPFTTIPVYFTMLSVSSVNSGCTLETVSSNFLLRPCHCSGGYSPTSHRGDPGSSTNQVMWDLWSTKWHWGRFSPSTSVSPANSHSTYCSTFIFYHPGLVQ